MTDAIKYLSKGSSIAAGAAGGSAAVLKGVKKIGAPDSSPGFWDGTDLLDEDTVMRPDGYSDPGKSTFDVFFDSAQHGFLITAKDNKTKLDFVITGPSYSLGTGMGSEEADAYTFTGSGYISKGGPNSEVKKGNDGTFEITWESAPVFAAG